MIGAVGRAEPQKRFDLLLEAFATSARAAAATAADHRGRRQPDATRLKALADALKLGGRRVCSSATAPTSHALHHAFDLFVQSSDYEGTPNAVLEAMALETPIVTTEAGGTTELVRDGEHALIVPCGDPAALDAAVERTLAESGGRAHACGGRAARTEGELSFDRRTRALEAIYARIVADHRAAWAA